MNSRFQQVFAGSPLIIGGFMGGTPPQHSVRKKIRVKKEDSAFIYFILESYEGIASYSTLDFKVGDPYRDLELRIPPDFVNEVDDLIGHFGELVYEIKPGLGSQ